jgi:stearoyl-CoA desaturase (delta-9 desaturase)
VHHNKVDTEKDPYNIKRGFWWAHIVWIFYLEGDGSEPEGVKDLQADKLVMFQHRHYLLLAILVAAVVPFGLGLLWGDAIGAMLICGFLRLVVQWHATFSINSFTHLIGKQPFSVENSARDSFLAALITLGEGYHNYHHRFATDYRNGVRWYHFDPTKWFVWSLQHVGLTRDLKRTAREKIERARESVREQKEAARSALSEGAASARQAFADTSASARQAFAETSASANALAQSVMESGRAPQPALARETSSGSN